MLRMIRSVVVLAFICVLIAPLGQAQAEQTTTYVSSILVSTTGVVNVSFTSNVSNLPCSLPYPTVLTFTVASSDGGKAALSALIAAKVSGVSVSVAGMGSCSAWTSTQELLGYVIVNPT